MMGAVDLSILAETPSASVDLLVSKELIKDSIQPVCPKSIQRKEYREHPENFKLPVAFLRDTLFAMVEFTGTVHQITIERTIYRDSQGSCLIRIRVCASDMRQ